MQEGETGHTLKKLGDIGTHIEPILPSPPGLKCGTGNVEHFGCLTLGQPLSLQSTILLEECGASEAIPALVTIKIAALLIIDYCTHSSLLSQPLSYWNGMAKDGEVAPLLQPGSVPSHSCSGPSSLRNGRRRDRGRFAQYRISEETRALIERIGKTHGIFASPSPLPACAGSRYPRAAPAAPPARGGRLPQQRAARRGAAERRLARRCRMGSRRASGVYRGRGPRDHRFEDSEGERQCGKRSWPHWCAPTDPSGVVYFWRRWPDNRGDSNTRRHARAWEEGERTSRP